MGGKKVANRQIIEALEGTDGMVYLAAERIGCAANTIYTRARSCKEVQAAIDHHRGKLLDIGELKLRSAVLRGEPWAVAFLLKTVGRKRGYVEKTEVEQSGALTVKWVEGDD